MKLKIIISLLLMFVLVPSYTQITTKSKHIEINSVAGVNSIFIFKNIDSNTEIRYSGNAKNIKWFKFESGKSIEISNLKHIYPENNSGYICNADGIETILWVFDYSKYPIKLSKLEAESNSNPCSDVNLFLTANISKMFYENSIGKSYLLDRKFRVKYSTLSWGNENWEDKDTVVNVSINNNIITVPAPLSTTTFTLVGDAFAEDLDLPINSISSNSYAATAIGVKILTNTTIREELNENSRPQSSNQLEGSAPMEIIFRAIATPATTNYTWRIFKNSELIVTRTEREHRYRFTESGNYKVGLEASNSTCKDSLFLDIKITDSQLFVPTVFTPNGDGKNDEFRVAYQSIIEFSGTIVNRWGRIVFSWDNPQHGWNGKIAGKNAPEGTYFYIIKAKGSDGKEYKLKGHLNLLR